MTFLLRLEARGLRKLLGQFDNSPFLIRLGRAKMTREEFSGRAHLGDACRVGMHPASLAIVYSFRFSPCGER
jgi:hypothetical protein